MPNSAIKLNDHTLARVLIDHSPEDPRKINAEGDAAEGFFVYDIDLIEGTRSEESPAADWFKTFRKLVYRHEPAVALRAMNILRSLGVELPGYIGLRRYRGYTPGDWADLVISGPTEEQAESYYKTYAAWARGDVYGINLERKCPITGGWFTLPDEDLPLWGIYWTGDAEFAEEVRSHAEEQWNLEAEPLSEEGESIQNRRQLEAVIGEKIERFELLQKAEGESLSGKLAIEIFKLYADLVEEYSDALENS